MKQLVLLAGIFVLLILPACDLANSEMEVASPDGNILVKLEISNEEGQVIFRAMNGETEITGPSILGLKLSGEGLDFTGNLELLEVKKKEFREEYTMPTGKQSQRLIHCNEAEYVFQNEAGSVLGVVFRIFNDGLAFRYRVENEKISSVEEEHSGIKIKDLHRLWSIPFSSGDERVFQLHEGTGELQEQPLSFPVLVESVTGHWMLFTEADVSDYPLSSGKFAGNRLDFVFAREKEAVNEVGPGFVSPWRVMMTGEDLSAIVENCMVDHLAPPSIFGGDIPDWVEAGVTSFPWWGKNIANSHPEILKSYIDLSAEMGWRFMEFDVALINAPVHAVEDWKTTPWIKDITDYGAERGVLCYGWDEYSNLNTAEKRTDIFGRYVDLGIVGCKVDFINSYSQATRRIVEEIIQDAARYELMLSFHGAQSPRGFARTYPHVITIEAVKGAEYYLEVTGGKGFPPSHNTILPFTRNVLGSADYTPVAFSTENRSTSMAHELALAVILESGWQGMCDVPEAYLESPGKDFLKGLPANWDETRFLTGYPGEYCCLARRKGEKWYVAGISAGDEREISLDLSPILESETSVVFYDDVRGEDDAILVSEKVLNPSEALPVSFKKNGGFAFIIQP